MTKKAQTLEVFQDLYLRHPDGPDAVRSAVLDHLDNGWIHAPQREKRSLALNDADMLALERLDSPAAAGVAMWMFSQTDGSYKVSNIVPLKSGELGIGGYNAALLHFFESVVAPASNDTALVHELSLPSQTIEGWAGAASAKALQTFSDLANKSTGRGHPMDEGRWLRFLVTAHREKSPLNSSQLARWLIQVETWQAEIATELASEYDLGRSLLKFYDEQR